MAERGEAVEGDARVAERLEEIRRVFGRGRPPVPGADLSELLVTGRPPVATSTRVRARGLGFLGGTLAIKLVVLSGTATAVGGVAVLDGPRDAVGSVVHRVEVWAGIETEVPDAPNPQPPVAPRTPGSSSPPRPAPIDVPTPTTAAPIVAAVAPPAEPIASAAAAPQDDLTPPVTAGQSTTGRQADQTPPSNPSSGSEPPGQADGTGPPPHANGPPLHANGRPPEHPPGNPEPGRPPDHAGDRHPTPGGPSH